MIDLTDPTLMCKQWAEIQETSFRNSVGSIEIFQKRAEKMLGQLVDQTLWASEKISDAIRTGYENLQKTMVPACAMVSKMDQTATEASEE